MFCVCYIRGKKKRMIRQSKGCFDSMVYMLQTALKDDSIEVTDATGVKHTVTKKTDTSGKDLYNIQAREYLYDNKDATTATNLYTTSSAVIHLIDSPLAYGD